MLERYKRANRHLLDGNSTPRSVRRDARQIPLEGPLCKSWASQTPLNARAGRGSCKSRRDAERDA